MLYHGNIKNTLNSLKALTLFSYISIDIQLNTMKLVIHLIILLFVCKHSCAQMDTSLSLNSSQTSLPQPLIKKHRSYFDSLNNCVVLRNQHASLTRKIIRGSALMFSVDAICFATLFAAPESFSKWDRTKILELKTNYEQTFTKPPVIDKDLWYINYVGHPLQGSYYYNAIRSQGATKLQSILFTCGHVIIWEYLIEGGMEQPSIQDLLVTPIAGSILGELTHYATLKMSNRGFKWYEKIAVCVCNPMYAINNGFKSAKPKNRIELN